MADGIDWDRYVFPFERDNYTVRAHGDMIIRFRGHELPFVIWGAILKTPDEMRRHWPTIHPRDVAK